MAAHLPALPAAPRAAYTGLWTALSVCRILGGAQLPAKYTAPQAGVSVSDVDMKRQREQPHTNGTAVEVRTHAGEAQACRVRQKLSHWSTGFLLLQPCSMPSARLRTAQIVRGH
jgi:hypothetical protein